MICPQTKVRCYRTRCKTYVMRLTCNALPPPTLAEIERLVDALVDAAIYSDVPDAQEARAALMAAIRAYGRE